MLPVAGDQGVHQGQIAGPWMPTEEWLIANLTGPTGVVHRNVDEPQEALVLMGPFQDAAVFATWPGRHFIWYMKAADKSESQWIINSLRGLKIQVPNSERLRMAITNNFGEYYLITIVDGKVEVEMVPIHNVAALTAAQLKKLSCLELRRHILTAAPQWVEPAVQVVPLFAIMRLIMGQKNTGKLLVVKVTASYNVSSLHKLEQPITAIRKQGVSTAKKASGGSFAGPWTVSEVAAEDVLVEFAASSPPSSHPNTFLGTFIATFAEGPQQDMPQLRSALTSAMLAARRVVAISSPGDAAGTPPNVMEDMVNKYLQYYNAEVTGHQQQLQQQQQHLQPQQPQHHYQDHQPPPPPQQHLHLQQEAPATPSQQASDMDAAPGAAAAAVATAAAAVAAAGEGEGGVAAPAAAPQQEAQEPAVAPDELQTPQWGRYEGYGSMSGDYHSPTSSAAFSDGGMQQPLQRVASATCMSEQQRRRPQAAAAAAAQQHLVHCAVHLLSASVAVMAGMGSWMESARYLQAGCLRQAPA